MKCRYLDVWHSGFLEQHNSKHDDLLMCRLKVLLIGGYLVNIWTGADRLIST